MEPDLEKAIEAATDKVIAVMLMQAWHRAYAELQAMIAVHENRGTEEGNRKAVELRETVDRLRMKIVGDQLEVIE